MCGIFGAISQSKLDKIKINKLAKSSQRRGKDSSGLFFLVVRNIVYGEQQKKLPA